MSGVWGFAIVDADKRFSVSELSAYAHTQTTQLIEHWAPFWRLFGVVHVGDPQPGEIEIRLLAHPTQAGALGLHDRQPDGTPIINVFDELAKAEGDTWTSVASHEVLEVLGDPYLGLCVQIGNEIWDHEVCDRVEADTYVCEGVTLSNFNTPACFEPSSAGHDRFDYLGLSKSPNEVRPGGYAQKYDPSKGWSMVGQMRGYRATLARLGLSRGARRAR